MMRERNNGHYASILYDKLFVNDSIYKYDDQTDQIVYIGKRTRPRGPRGDIGVGVETLVSTSHN